MPDATPEQVAALSGYVDGVAEEAYCSGLEHAREPLLAALKGLVHNVSAGIQPDLDREPRLRTAAHILRASISEARHAIEEASC